MASRAIPPHHGISAPLMAITPLRISALAEEARAEESAAAIHRNRFMFHSPRLTNTLGGFAAQKLLVVSTPGPSRETEERGRSSKLWDIRLFAGRGRVDIF